MKRCMCLILGIVLALNFFVSCEPMREMTEEEALQEYAEFLKMLKDPQLFEDACVVETRSSMFNIDQGERIYYYCTQEKIDEINERYDQAMSFLSTIDQYDNFDVRGTYIIGTGKAIYIDFQFDDLMWYHEISVKIEDDGSALILGMHSEDPLFISFKNSDKLEKLIIEECVTEFLKNST